MIHSLELVVMMSDLDGRESEAGRAFWGEGHELRRREFFTCVEGLHAEIDRPWTASRTFVRVELHNRTETIQAKISADDPIETAHTLWMAIAEAGDKV